MVRTSTLCYFMRYRLKYTLRKHIEISFKSSKIVTGYNTVSGIKRNSTRVYVFYKKSSSSEIPLVFLDFFFIYAACCALSPESPSPLSPNPELNPDPEYAPSDEPLPDELDIFHFEPDPEAHSSLLSSHGEAENRRIK